MLASSVNDGVRSLEGIVARWHKDTNASLQAGGTADVITVAANQTISSYYDGLEIAFDAAVGTNTGAVTLNVDGVGAVAVVKHGATALAAGDIQVGQKVIVVYDGTNWQLVSQLGSAPQPLDATLTSLAALGTAADKIAYTTGVDTWAETPLTAVGRALLDDTTAAAQRTTLGLGTGDTPDFTGLVGTTTNDSAASGAIGEVISSTVASGSAVSLTSSTAANITSISLTAGDWDVYGTIGFSISAASTMGFSIGGITTSSATTPVAPYRDVSYESSGAAITPEHAIPTQRISLAGTTTVYLVANANFVGGTVDGYGYIQARRIR